MSRRRLAVESYNTGQPLNLRVGDIVASSASQTSARRNGDETTLPNKSAKKRRGGSRAAAADIDTDEDVVVAELAQRAKKKSRSSTVDRRSSPQSDYSSVLHESTSSAMAQSSAGVVTLAEIAAGSSVVRPTAEQGLAIGSGGSRGQVDDARRQEQPHASHQRTLTSMLIRKKTESGGGAAAGLTDLSPSSVRAALHQRLQSAFGHKTFRPKQLDIMLAVCSGRDVMAVLPTGAGKSLCYQLPSVVLGGTAVVVSPLLALMDDQVAALKAHGINASLLSSRQKAVDRKSILLALTTGKHAPTLLYVTPELIRSSRQFEKAVRMAAGERRISLLVVDEAHVISSWGHDFRPAFRDLVRIREWCPGTPVIALTATATRQVKEDICTQLHMRSPSIHLLSFNRPNIDYSVRFEAALATSPADDLQALLKSRLLRNSSGLIYCWKRETCDELAADLRSSGVVPTARSFHAGVSNREKLLQQWICGEVKVMVATIAFGMGIDKSDCRFVVHYDLPSSLEGFYQESGRAGRDGEQSFSILYCSADAMRRRVFVERKQTERATEKAEKDGNEASRANASARLDRALAALQKVWQFCVKPAFQCRRACLLAHFGEQVADVQKLCNQSCDWCRKPRDCLQAARLEEGESGGGGQRLGSVVGPVSAVAASGFRNRFSVQQQAAASAAMANANAGNSAFIEDIDDDDDDDGDGGIDNDEHDSAADYPGFSRPTVMQSASTLPQASCVSHANELRGLQSTSARLDMLEQLERGSVSSSAQSQIRGEPSFLSNTAVTGGGQLTGSRFNQRQSQFSRPRVGSSGVLPSFSMSRIGGGPLRQPSSVMMSASDSAQIRSSSSVLSSGRVSESFADPSSRLLTAGRFTGTSFRSGTVQQKPSGSMAGGFQSARNVLRNSREHQQQDSQHAATDKRPSQTSSSASNRRHSLLDSLLDKKNKFDGEPPRKTKNDIASYFSLTGQQEGAEKKKPALPAKSSAPSTTISGKTKESIATVTTPFTTTAITIEAPTATNSQSSSTAPSNNNKNNNVSNTNINSDSQKTSSPPTRKIGKAKDGSADDSIVSAHTPTGKLKEDDSIQSTNDNFFYVPSDDEFDEII